MNQTCPLCRGGHRLSSCPRWVQTYGKAALKLGAAPELVALAVSQWDEYLRNNNLPKGPK